MNHDPNMVLCGKRARSEVRLTFALWEYRYETTVLVSANIMGHSVLDAAIDNILDSLHDEEGRFCIVMKDKDGNELICDDDSTEGDAENYMRDALIGFEVVSFEPAGSLFED